MLTRSRGNPMLKLLAAAAALVLVAACATSTTDNSGEMVEVVSAETRMTHNDLEDMGITDPDRMVCRNERVTGTIRPKRVCMTAGEWARAREAGRDAAGSLIDKSIGACTGPSCAG